MEYGWQFVQALTGSVVGLVILLLLAFWLVCSILLPVFVYYICRHSSETVKLLKEQNELLRRNAPKVRLPG